MKKQKLNNLHNDAAASHQETVAPTEGNYAESLERNSLEGEKLHIVSFYLNGDEYAFEVTDAVEVLRSRQVTEVPRTPWFISGILSVRGEMVPVIDLKKRLGLATDGPAAGRILITAADDLKAGFTVDRLAGVKEVPVKSVEAPDEKGSRFLRGVIRAFEAPILLLNISLLTDMPPGSFPKTERA
ncbi:MAG: purine-binding chemotaxis protein CheW [Deltaproteobacteria bacterium]|nr:purine-binding chemotaxis protein CheW [Deltaproteobacteria bacterium]